MIVRCNVGGCSWTGEHHLKTQLDLLVEGHRVDKHSWVKQGRLGRVERDALELIQDEAHAANAT